MSGKLKVLIALLLAATCIVAAVHVSQQKDISCMVIRASGQEIPVAFSDLDQQEFSGETVNGKGDVSFRTYRGVLLKDLLAAKGLDVSGLKVTSADNYAVEFTREEIGAADTVYAAVTADGAAIEGIDPGTAGVQIIVFGDPSSRRCVRYAAILELLP